MQIYSRSLEILLLESAFSTAYGIFTPNRAEMQSNEDCGMPQCWYFLGTTVVAVGCVSFSENTVYFAHLTFQPAKRIFCKSWDQMQDQNSVEWIMSEIVQINGQLRCFLACWTSTLSPSVPQIKLKKKNNRNHRCFFYFFFRLKLFTEYDNIVLETVCSSI